MNPDDTHSTQNPDDVPWERFAREHETWWTRARALVWIVLLEDLGGWERPWSGDDEFYE
jgi:hypothetical protein